MKRAVLFAVGTLFAVSIFAQGIKDLDDAWVKAAKAGDHLPKGPAGPTVSPHSVRVARAGSA